MSSSKAKRLRNVYSNAKKVSEILTTSTDNTGVWVVRSRSLFSCTNVTFQYNLSIFKEEEESGR